jgi:hypothetical protein
VVGPMRADSPSSSIKRASDLRKLCVVTSPALSGLCAGLSRIERTGPCHNGVSCARQRGRRSNRGGEGILV